MLLADIVGDGERRRRFIREARAAARVDHANIATVYDVGDADGGVYLTMERVEGSTLRARLAVGPLDAAEATHVARQLALGLSRAHHKVHRAPRSEARQHHAHARRRGEDPRFRARQAARARLGESTRDARNRALLEAIEPLAGRARPDEKETLRRLEAAMPATPATRSCCCNSPT